jgi:hypothetical protein
VGADRAELAGDDAGTDAHIEDLRGSQPGDQLDGIAGAGAVVARSVHTERLRRTAVAEGLGL